MPDFVLILRLEGDKSLQIGFRADSQHEAEERGQTTAKELWSLLPEDADGRR